MIHNILYAPKLRLQQGASHEECLQFTYPFSSPSSKFLDWEKGVVKEIGGDWELRDGIAYEGKGEAKVTARANERRLGRTLCPSTRFGLWVFSLGTVFV